MMESIIKTGAERRRLPDSSKSAREGQLDLPLLGVLDISLAVQQAVVATKGAPT